MMQRFTSPGYAPVTNFILITAMFGWPGPYVLYSAIDSHDGQQIGFGLFLTLVLWLLCLPFTVQFLDHLRHPNLKSEEDGV
jgi:hypothetical protein